MPATEHWIFAYGSLMWRPGFACVEAQPAELVGFRRCFCVYSVHHRGTRARPGLVLGLDRGGACTGIAFRVAPENAPAIEAYLRAREQVEGVYRAVHVPVELVAERREVFALAFVVERSHLNYAGRLSVDRQARIIAAAAGISGANTDYLINTLAHLRTMGLRERELERVLACVGPFAARPGQGDDAHARPSARALQRVLSRRPPLAPPRLPKQPSRRFLFRRQDRLA
ncbi:MAG: gamma-glutamylcyclotransferase [Hyphomicrobiaceae bacterium]|nr:gamma-glutamylcyclotransferase [Hyphomicrobiaceae bacterium]